MENDEHRDEMPYGTEPKTEFQKFIRLGKEGKPVIIGMSKTSCFILNYIVCTCLVCVLSLIFIFYSIGKLHAEMLGSAPPELAQSNHLLYDHRPLKLNIEDYQRVCHIPVKKV